MDATINGRQRSVRMPDGLQAMKLAEQIHALGITVTARPEVVDEFGRHVEWIVEATLPVVDPHSNAGFRDGAAQCDHQWPAPGSWHAHECRFGGNHGADHRCQCGEQVAR